MKRIIGKLLRYFGIKVSIMEGSILKPKIDKNTIVKNKIGNYDFLMNFAHVHNSNSLYENYSKNLPRLVKQVETKYSNLTVIDIGANIGDSVALIKSIIDVPFICIEGDKFYFDLLQKNVEQFKDVICFNNYLSMENGYISASPIDRKSVV